MFTVGNTASLPCIHLVCVINVRTDGTLLSPFILTDDPCAASSCAHDCSTDNGIIVCTCRDGYVLNEDGLSCNG